MIAATLVALLAVAGFGYALWRTRILAVSQEVVDAGMTGIGTILDRELDDDQKEAALKTSGLALIGGAWRVGWRFAAALAAAAVPILGADLLGVVGSDRVMGLMLRLDFIVIVSVAAIALVWVFRRLRPAPDQAPEQAQAAEAAPTEETYSRTDRVFHLVAFSGPGFQKRMSRLEDRMLGKRVDMADAERPIFVTSLARGGTTAVLNALNDLPGIATHRYRDMPFLTSPLLWERLSKPDSRVVTRRKRAHGDGLEIDLNSPEAFDEVVWRLLWPGKYGETGIDPWTAADRAPEAEAFLARHFAKIVALRRAHPTTAGPEADWRYCSKNNANIGRLDFLTEAFPECRIVVPLRRPEAHAASLMRQHLNFIDLQTRDDFVRRYMRDIGHLEFGLIHSPILFPGFDPDRYAPDSPDYWLDYWIHAVRAALAAARTPIFVMQDALRADPQPVMEGICAEIGVATAGAEFAPYFLTRPDEAPSDPYTPKLLAEAREVYEAAARLSAGGGMAAELPGAQAS